MILGQYEIHDGDEVTTGVEELDWASIRHIRDGFLVKTDAAIATPDRWTDEQLNLLLAYRVLLRDLPGTYELASDAQMNFPDEPEFMI